MLRIFRLLSISAPRKCFAFPRSRAFVKCPQARKNSHIQASLQWLFITHLYALISLLSRIQLNISSSIVMDYSMIVATRPEPTVLPPSRFYLFVIYDFLLIFLWFSISYFQYFAKLSLLLKFLEPL